MNLDELNYFLIPKSAIKLYDITLLLSIYLFQQHHFFHILVCAGRNSVDVDACAETGGVEMELVATRINILAVKKGSYLLTSNIINLDGDHAGYGNVKPDGCRRIERIWIVIKKLELARGGFQCVTTRS